VTRLLYVTGVSCAGKTSLGQALREHEGVHWVDLDEHADNRPKTAWLDWLRWRAAELLREADAKAGRDGTPPLVIVTGIVWPFRVIESPAWPDASKNHHLEVNWLMLDPAWKVLRERLRERTANKPKSERRALLDYNRGLREPIRRQVLAVHGGWTLRSNCTPDELACEVLDLNREMTG
jgi:hypothetical protein